MEGAQGFWKNTGRGPPFVLPHICDLLTLARIPGCNKQQKPWNLWLASWTVH